MALPGGSPATLRPRVLWRRPRRLSFPGRTCFPVEGAAAATFVEGVVGRTLARHLRNVWTGRFEWHRHPCLCDFRHRGQTNARVKSTKPHRQECLCHLNAATACWAFPLLLLG